MMRNARTAAALVGGLATLAVAFSLQAQEQGRALFQGKANCYACHGKDAQGGPLAPSLRDTIWLNVKPVEAEVAGLIRSGVPRPKKHPAPMPPMGGAKLSDEEIAALAKYVVSLGPPK